MYALVMNTLFSIDLFTITQLDTIPGLTPERSGYNRIAIYNDQIIVTNEKQFFVWSDSKQEFYEVAFNVNGRPIRTYNTSIASFGRHTIVGLQEEDKNYVAELVEGNCKVIYVANNDCDFKFNQSGVAIIAC